MRRARDRVITFALVGAVVALFAGCGGPNPDEATTPPNAQTVKNGEYLSDKKKDAEGGEGGEGGADVAAGKTAFEGKCQSCHLNGGNEGGGAGPVLKDKGLAAAAIEAQIVNGKGAMPGGLAEGEDLKTITAYVVSIQGKKPEGGDEPAGGAPAEGGDDPAIAAGAKVYEGACQSCHGANGAAGPVGPQIAGKGRAEDFIRNQIVNGGGAMPGGLATGEDLENLVKYLVSLQ